MFEKEAEEYQTRKHHQRLYGNKPVVMKELNITYKDGFKDGYNKANEWHYVNWKYFADKDCPKSELSSYLVQLKNKDFLICDWEMEEGFGCFWDSNLNPIDNDDVSAWKEIVLPKECK